MKKIFPLLIVFLSLSARIFSENSFVDELIPTIEKKIWIDNSFTNQEIQLLSNVIFLSIYRAQSQKACLYYANELATFALVAEKNIRRSFDQVGIEGLKISVDNIQALHPRIKTIIALHENVIDQLSNHSNRELLKVFQSCAEQAANVAIKSCNAQKNKIMQLLTKAQNNYGRQSENMRAVADSLSALENDANSEKNSHMAQTIESVRHTIFAMLDESIFQAHDGKNEFGELTYSLENSALDLFKQYYKIIYQGMQERSLPSSYYSILASENECAAIKFAQLPDPSLLEN
ncbi:MAG TPA: hypothetical protein VHO47_02310 [Candidatus Babeliales bacterium]|nr:hypothetical protein [Candidatus Babeliales bacterium]